MKNYTFTLNSKDIDSTNECLIKLWASFLNNGKFGWHYRPWKDGNKIDVGDVSVHDFGSYNVIFSSKTKKIVTSVIFEKHNNEKLTNKEIDYFDNINDERFKLNKKQFLFAMSFKIDSFFGVKYIYPFSNDIFSVYCIDDKQYIECEVNGFCKEHVSEQVFELSQLIADFLSTQINSAVEVNNITLLTKKTLLSKEIKSLIQKDDNWMDEYPINNSHFILPEYAKKLLEKIILNDNADLLVLLKVFHHFSHATKLQQKNIQNELITSQLMSSVEVLTELEEHNTANCKECGQSIYSIRKRVLSLIENDLSEHLIKIFDNYYATRSKYLHSGLLVSNRQYTGVCLPKISDKFKNGCEEYPLRQNTNLIEWIGFLIRKKTKSFVINKHNKTE